MLFNSLEFGLFFPLDAVYDPFSRIVRGTPPPASRQVLEPRMQGLLQILGWAARIAPTDIRLARRKLE
jgi:hypothetical protein